MAKIIGLAGYRRTGKSEIAKHLIEEHGFQSVHPFGVWKVGCMAMLEAMGADPDTAWDMINGHLKDTPSDLLPGGVCPRYLMEKLGNWAGTSAEMGPSWTIGTSLKAALASGNDAPLVVESVVYEVDEIHKMGGHIIMVNRPGRDGDGLDTDKKTDKIVPDSYFLNPGDDLTSMKIALDDHLKAHGLIEEKDYAFEI